MDFFRRIERLAEVDIITVLVSIHQDTHGCVNLLETQLRNEGIKGVQIKTLDQCRGVEYPILVSISEGDTIGPEGSVLLDAWTRVTSTLFIIHKESKGDMFSFGLKRALDQKQAISANNKDELVSRQWPRHWLRSSFAFCTFFLICWGLKEFCEQLRDDYTDGKNFLFLCAMLLIPILSNWLYLRHFRGLRIGKFWN